MSTMVRVCVVLLLTSCLVLGLRRCKLTPQCVCASWYAVCEDFTMEKTLDFTLVEKARLRKLTLRRGAIYNAPHLSKLAWPKLKVSTFARY